MASIQYKTTSGGAWTDVPHAALEGTAEGMVMVEYPQATDRDGTGAPCAAIGKPQIVIRSRYMSAAGMAHWQGRIASGESAAAWQTAYDPRTGAFAGWTGTLLRPRFNPPITGGNNVPIYTDVEIIIDNISAVTWP